MCNIKSHFVAIATCLILVTQIVAAEILVNINVNKPIHDVNERFVSFSLPPEMLFSTLDGPHKRTFTDMAILLGPSYLKLTGDFFFPTDLNSTLKNPTQAIWSGFNRWTSAMNWTMVIPVHYTPLSWDPIDALKVLNISNGVGIENCIWQLGLDFAASRAADYVADLHTLDTMVDTFRPYVKEWRVIGADITAGSSAEETKRYINISGDVNTAFGWTQPPGYYVEENTNGFIYDKDHSLKVLIEKKVPLWLSIPPKSPMSQMRNSYTNTDVPEGLRWAQTLGDAASSGFAAVFKPLTLDDVSTPNFSLYVSALFKKIMGNRVFPPKSLKRNSYSSKLYTHCANGISGGIAFMGVNTEDYSVKVSAKPSAKFTGSEVWQFILTSKKGSLFLNTEELFLNTTLDPFVRIKHPNKPLAMSMPPMSVGFWVLPLANHEDCQFTELLAPYSQEAQWENRQRRQSSSDRLLKQLIMETSLTEQMKSRRRRDTSSFKLKKGKLSTRQKRFILQEKPRSNPEPIKPSTQVLQKTLKKREDAQNWLKSLVLNQGILPKVDWGLKRKRRATDFLSAFFPKESGLRQSILRRQNTLHSQKQKPIDQESIFKTIDIEKKLCIPEGDVHFQYITGVNGEEIESNDNQEEFEQEKRPQVVNKELPTEFYESYNPNLYQTKLHQQGAPSSSHQEGMLHAGEHNPYMTRNQLEMTSFEEKQKEHEKVYATYAEHHGDHDEPHRETEFIMPPYNQMSAKRFRKPSPEPVERDSSKSFMNIPSTLSLQWPPAYRTRRSIGHGKYNKQYKSFQDNLISKDEYEKPISSSSTEITETGLDESIPDTKIAAINVRNHVSRIIDVVKSHVTGFFNTFIN